MGRRQRDLETARFDWSSQIWRAWGLLVALLVVMGMAAPMGAPDRPTIEDIGTAPPAVLSPILVARPRTVVAAAEATVLLNPDPGAAASPGQAFRRTPPPKGPEGAPPRAYEATGPPQAQLPQAA